MAERLVGRFAEFADPERTGEVGQWLLECESGEELLGRVKASTSLLPWETPPRRSDDTRRSSPVKQLPA